MYYDDLECAGRWMREHCKEFDSYEDLADAAIKECYVEDDEYGVIDTKHSIIEMAKFYMG